jgi:hypothetical protein
LIDEADEGALHVVLEERNEKHDADAGRHTQDLEAQLG